MTIFGISALVLVSLFSVEISAYKFHFLALNEYKNRVLFQVKFPNVLARQAISDADDRKKPKLLERPSINEIESRRIQLSVPSQRDGQLSLAKSVKKSKTAPKSNEFHPMVTRVFGPKNRAPLSSFVVGKKLQGQIISITQ